MKSEEGKKARGQEGEYAIWKKALHRITFHKRGEQHDGCGIAQMLCIPVGDMQFTATYDLPEQVAMTLRHHWNKLAKANLEDLAVIGYTMGILTSYQIQQMLHHASRWETEQFLRQHQCYLHYNSDDFQHDGDVFQEARESPQA